jgi:hypothetical protein
MSQANLTIENTPQLLMFMRLWMASGPMVLTTVEGICQISSDKKIELPEIQGRDFSSELRTFYSAFGELIERLA